MFLFHFKAPRSIYSTAAVSQKCNIHPAITNDIYPVEERGKVWSGASPS